jgi:nucleoside-diphosphate-sugar epimerase
MYQSVLITGASGFIGSHLVRHQLSLGLQVRALDVCQPKTQAGSGAAAVERMVGDISDPVVQEKAAQGVDLVFHLASAHLAVNVPEETYWRVNVHCLGGFLERCRSAGVKRFVHVSSVGVYGNVENPPANEDSPCRPDLLYERTKYEGELQVKKYFEKTGFPIVIVRPSWVYGPGCPRTEKLFHAIKKGRFFFIGDGSALRHCVYISDMTEALNLCAERPNAPGNIFVIADRGAVTVRALIEQMAATAGVSAPRFSVPVWLAKPLFGLIEGVFARLGKEPPVSERSVKFFTNNTSFDVSRARKDLGFDAKVSLPEGLRLTHDTLAQAGRMQVRAAA